VSDDSHLAALRDYYKRQQAFPAMAKLCSVLGLASTSSVFALVGRLVTAGYLERTEGRIAPTRKFFARPLLGSVRAGLPQPADQAAADVLTLDDYLIDQPNRTSLHRVRGDSMKDVGILEGDLVAVEHNAPSSPGDIVVAVVDGDMTVKTLPILRTRLSTPRPASKSSGWSSASHDGFGGDAEHPDDAALAAPRPPQNLGAAGVEAFLRLKSELQPESPGARETCVLNSNLPVVPPLTVERHLVARSRFGASGKSRCLTPSACRTVSAKSALKLPRFRRLFNTRGSISTPWAVSRRASSSYVMPRSSRSSWMSARRRTLFTAGLATADKLFHQN